MPHPSAADPAARRPGEHFLISFDGTAVRFWVWSPPNPKPHAPLVLLVHGAGEYAERYRPFADFLNQHGYPVAALDLRGFGGSLGPRAFVRHFSDYVRDLDAVAAQSARLTGATRIHLMGHSMGGLVAASAAAESCPAALASLTLSSPCFGLSFPVPAHLRAIGAVCSVLVPQKLFPTRAISELLTHDTAIANAHRTDPQIVHFMSARLFFEMQKQMSSSKRFARRVRVPTAVFQAGDDRVVSQTASHDFFQSLTVQRKHWQLYPGLFHEILNETSRAGVYQDILNFIESV